MDTWYLKQGDVYFIPRAYPHHIEVVESPGWHFTIFFDQPTPGCLPLSIRLRSGPGRRPARQSRADRNRKRHSSQQSQRRGAGHHVVVSGAESEPHTDYCESLQ